MEVYLSRPHLIEGTQWLKHGDHEAVIPFKEDDSRCGACGGPTRDHGWLDKGKHEEGEMVCPGDFIVANRGAYGPEGLSVILSSSITHNFMRLTDAEAKTYVSPEVPACRKSEPFADAEDPVLLDENSRLWEKLAAQIAGPVHAEISRVWSLDPGLSQSDREASVKDCTEHAANAAVNLAAEIITEVAARRKHMKNPEVENDR